MVKIAPTGLIQVDCGDTKVKNTDWARHKEEQMVQLGVSFPLQDLLLVVLHHASHILE